MSSKARIPFVMTLLIVLSAGLAGAHVAADTILYGGKVFTSVDGDLWAEAVAVRGRWVVAVGSTAEVMKHARPHTRLIDLEGRLVVPGFNDAHTHTLPLNTLGPFINDPGFIPGPGPDLNEMLAYLQVATAQYPAGTWLFGIVGEAFLDGPPVDRFLLDPVAADHPLVLLGWGGHKVYLNTAAMQAAGIAETEPDPFGGYYERLPGSEVLTGVLIEYAHYRLFGFLASALTVEEARAELSAAYDNMIRLGTTSVQQMNVLSTARLEEIMAGIDLPLRVRTICYPLTLEQSRQGCRPGPGMNSPFRLSRFSGVKWITDGTPIESHMALSEPYADKPDWWGTFNFPLDVFAEQVSDALYGPPLREQRLIHSVGDYPVDALLDAMEAAAPDQRWRRRRLRLEHGDMIRPDHYDRLAGKGVIVVQNPTHLAVPELFAKRIGPARMQHLEPLRSLLDAGIVLALGSDAIGGTGNPFVDIMLAVIHPGHPEEAISIEDAVIAYTWGSAYAEGMEHLKGTLQPGRLADLAVLSQDIFSVPPNQLPMTGSLLTMVDGTVVLDTGVLASE